MSMRLRELTCNIAFLANDLWLFGLCLRCLNGSILFVNVHAIHRRSGGGRVARRRSSCRDTNGAASLLWLDITLPLHLDNLLGGLWPTVAGRLTVRRVLERPWHFGIVELVDEGLLHETQGIALISATRSRR